MYEQANLCDRHQTIMRDRVNERGYGFYIADDGHEAVAKLSEMLGGTFTIATFEPLILATYAALLSILHLRGQAPEGEDCAACDLDVWHAARCESLTCTFDAGRLLTQAVDQVIDLYNRHTT